MTNHDNDLARLLQRAAPPLGAERPRRDLWIEVRARLDRREGHLAWFDWVIAAAAATGLAVLPEVWTTLLYLL
jgi:hypothetical protein